MRRSARLKTIRAENTSELASSAHDENDETGDNDIDFEQAKPTRRRRKAKTTAANPTNQPFKKSRGNRGKLQQLTEFPLDVLFEVLIFSLHGEPPLTPVNQDFRSPQSFGRFTSCTDHKSPPRYPYETLSHIYLEASTSERQRSRLSTRLDRTSVCEFGI
jgi:hypothetical protein